jgi:hypothetical protein
MLYSIDIVPCSLLSQSNAERLSSSLDTWISVPSSGQVKTLNILLKLSPTLLSLVSSLER